MFKDINYSLVYICTRQPKDGKMNLYGFAYQGERGARAREKMFEMYPELRDEYEYVYEELKTKRLETEVL